MYKYENGMTVHIVFQKKKHYKDVHFSLMGEKHFFFFFLRVNRKHEKQNHGSKLNPSLNPVTCQLDSTNICQLMSG